MTRAGDGVRAARPASGRARISRPAARSPSQEAARRAVMQRLFELDAAVADADLGIGLRGRAWRSPRSTAPRWSWPATTCSTRVRHPRTRPAAAAGHRPRPHRDLPLDQRRDRRLPRRRERPGRPARRQLPARMLNLADRGFFSMHRSCGSPHRRHLAWRVRPRESVPLKTLKPCPTALSWSCCTNQTAAHPAQAHTEPRAERLPDTTARLVAFTVTPRPAAADKTSRMRC